MVAFHGGSHPRRQQGPGEPLVVRDLACLLPRHGPVPAPGRDARPRGLREATVADADALAAWMCDHAVGRTRDAGRLGVELEQRCRDLSIEPPTPERVERIIRTAVRAYEERLYSTVHDRLTADMRARLDALLQPAGPADAAAAEVGVEQEGRATAPLVFLRSDPGRASVNSLREELARLDAIRRIGLPRTCSANGARRNWRPADSASPSKRPTSCGGAPM